STPPSRRPSAYFYEAVPQYSPALRRFGAFGSADSLVGGWAKRALLAQPGDFIAAGWTYFRSYFVPSSLPARLKGSSGLDPQLDFTNGGNIIFVAAALESLKAFFDPFTVHHV